LEKATTVDGLSDIIDRMAERILASGLTFSAIAFSGISGCLIGPTLALRIKKDLLVIRKPDDDDSHSSSRLEGILRSDPYDGKFHYIIVDDLVCSGDTVARIVGEVSKVAPESVCKGVFIWSSYASSPVKITDGLSVRVFTCPEYPGVSVADMPVPPAASPALLAPPPMQGVADMQECARMYSTNSSYENA
jgi:adenine/guanine phosphoribosyltransferase-like PRPP-binding protein